jgi:hypothetical protein
MTITRPHLLLCALILMVAASAPSGALAQSRAGAAPMTGEVSPNMKQVGCWDCLEIQIVSVCSGGAVPGYWNCSVNGLGRCTVSGAGCGVSLTVPVDPDGSTQYVSRGAALDAPRLDGGGGGLTRRNCDGVIIARQQGQAAIAAVRADTDALAL